MWAINITSVSPTKNKFLKSNARYFIESGAEKTFGQAARLFIVREIREKLKEKLFSLKGR